jgi:cytosine permease
VAVLLLFGDLLALVSQWLTLLGVLSTGLAGLVITDYFIVRRLLLSEAGAPEAVNWAGVVVLFFGTWLAHIALPQIVPIEFFPSLGFSLLCYPPLRIVTLRLRERRRIVAACPK